MSDARRPAPGTAPPPASPRRAGWTGAALLLLVLLLPLLLPSPPARAAAPPEGDVPAPAAETPPSPPPGPPGAPKGVSTPGPEEEERPGPPPGPPGAPQGASTAGPEEAQRPGPPEGSLVDRTHGFLAGTVADAVAWTDDFFGDERIEVEGLPESFLRWRNGFVWTETEGAEFKTRLHANVHLPRAERRFRLLLTGTDDDPDAPQTPQNQEGSVSLDLLRKARAFASVRAGVRFGDPIDPFVKIRFRYDVPLGGEAFVRFTLEPFWRRTEEFGVNGAVDLEVRPLEKNLFRLGLSGMRSQESDGVEWGASSSVRHIHSLKTALSLEIGVSGVTEPEPEATSHYAQFRFRQNVFREWFYYEAVPGIVWDREPDGTRPPHWVAALYVEFQLGGKVRQTGAADRRPPPGEAPSGSAPAGGTAPGDIPAAPATPGAGSAPPPPDAPPSPALPAEPSPPPGGPGT